MAKNTNANKEIIVATGAAEVAAETIVAAPAAAEAPVVIQVAAAVSKASVANAIFKDMFAMQPVPQRKDMIKRAMNEAKLTEKGAATYLQNFKAKNNLVNKKAVTA